MPTLKTPADHARNVLQIILDQIADRRIIVNDATVQTYRDDDGYDVALVRVKYRQRG